MVLKKNKVLDIKENANKFNLAGNTNLETDDEKTARIRSLWVMNIETFIFALSFSIVITGVLPYLRQLLPSNSEEEIIWKYSTIVAINPLAQVIFSPIFGFWHNRIQKIRPIGLSAAAVFIVGNLLYSILSVVPSENGRYGLLLLSRFLTGAASGNNAAFRNYITTATFSSERTKYISIAAGFQCLGMTIGPALQASLSPLQCSKPSMDSYISFDMFTAAGWISIGTGIISALLLLPCLFTEFDVSKKEHDFTLGKNSKNAFDEESDQTKKSHKKPDYFAVFVCVVMFFFYWASFTAVETAGTPISMDQFGWNSDEVVLKYGCIMGGIGALAFIGFFSVGPISERIDERFLILVFGVCSMIVGNVFFMPLPNNENTHICPSETNSSVFRLISPLGKNVPCGDVEKGCCSLDWCKEQPAMNVVQFVIGFCIIAAGHPFRVSLTQSLLTKILGPVQQGTWLGILTATGSAARAAGPFLVGWLYNDYGTYWTFGITFIWLGASVILLVVSYKRLVPYQHTKENDCSSDELKKEVTRL